MKIAGVSMTYNDGFKLKEWTEHYQTYKNQLGIFVIVDNGSEAQYRRELREAFPDAVIIQRETNGGCTAAYNDGIRYVLEKTDAEAIAIIGNDIKVTPGCLPAMYDYLMGDDQLGIVSAAMLGIDSNIIDNYGHKVHNFNITYEDHGKAIEGITPKQKYTDLVSGGFTMAKREFYVKAGLQDEALFMYCDELDTMLKAQKNGYKIGVIGNEYVWHWHINDPKRNGRSSASRYLICRNRVYLAKKYLSKLGYTKILLKCLIYVPAIYVVNVIRRRDILSLQDAQYSFIGAIHGAQGKMYQNKYTEFN